VAQDVLEPNGRLPLKNLYPVTLPLSEAKQGIKVTLAGSAVNKRKLMPRLSGADICVTGASLIYLPFHETAHEMIQQHTHVSINKNSLEFGRFL